MAPVLALARVQASVPVAERVASGREPVEQAVSASASVPQEEPVAAESVSVSAWAAVAGLVLDLALVPAVGQESDPVWGPAAAQVGAPEQAAGQGASASQAALLHWDPQSRACSTRKWIDTPLLPDKDGLHG